MNERISVDSQIHFGKPCIAGTRIPVQNVLEQAMRIFLQFTLGFSLVLSCSVLAFAQSSGIEGTVFDQNGAVVAGLDVVANGAGQKTYAAKTDSPGKYSLKLPQGFYSVEITVKYNSFCPIRFKNYKVVEKMRFDVVLDEGRSSQDRTKCKTKTVKF